MRLRTILFLAFLIIPIVEIALFLAIGRSIGVGPTILIVLVTAVAGSYLVARQGRQTWDRLTREFTEGTFPAKSLAHGAMILVAGVLLLTPGFLTDAVGFALLFSPVREFIRLKVLARYRDRWIVVQ
jgi:UPF0716 protein FxsA